MNITYILWLTGAAGVFLGAATASRGYIGNSNIWLLVLSLGLYLVGNLMMLRLMREGGLGLAISLSAIVQLIMVNVIAYTVFGERLSPVQIAGVGLGVVAMALMMMPGSGRA